MGKIENVFDVIQATASREVCWMWKCPRCDQENTAWSYPVSHCENCSLEVNLKGGERNMRKAEIGKGKTKNENPHNYGGSLLGLYQTVTENYYCDDCTVWVEDGMWHVRIVASEQVFEITSNWLFGLEVSFKSGAIWPSRIDEA